MKKVLFGCAAALLAFVFTSCEGKQCYKLTWTGSNGKASFYVYTEKDNLDRAKEIQATIRSIDKSKISTTWVGGSEESCMDRNTK